jgi:hypothetical protein
MHEQNHILSNYHKVQILNIKGFSLKATGKYLEAVKVLAISCSIQCDDQKIKQMAQFNYASLLWSFGEKPKAASEWLGFRQIRRDETISYYQQKLTELQIKTKEIFNLLKSGEADENVEDNEDELAFLKLDIECVQFWKDSLSLIPDSWEPIR